MGVPQYMLNRSNLFAGECDFSVRVTYLVTLVQHEVLPFVLKEEVLVDPDTSVRGYQDSTLWGQRSLGCVVEGRATYSTCSVAYLATRGG